MSQHSGSSSDYVKACVKWFNGKAGYGFLTVLDGEKKDVDEKRKSKEMWKMLSLTSTFQ